MNTLKCSHLAIALLAILIWMTKGGSSDENLGGSDSDGGFHANVDLYGFGIRLGVYLQWFSSWICNTLNPSLAAVNHDVNSIFVLALVSAMFAARSSMRDVEVYIMLLICYGYVFTVLTIFDTRVRLLSPATLPSFVEQMSSMWEQTQTGLMQRCQQISEGLDTGPTGPWLRQMSLLSVPPVCP